MKHSRKEIKEKLKEILVLTDVNPTILAGEVDDGLQLVRDLGFSSVTMLYVVIGVEEMFGIRFTGLGTADFKTVGDVVDYIEKAEAEKN